jgi:hypothetical protein
MKKILTLLIFLGLFMASCNDQINIPVVEGGAIDTIPPTIDVMSLQPNQEWVGVDTIPIKVLFADDYELSFVRVMVNPSDLTFPYFEFVKNLEQKEYLLDTFYVLPLNFNPSTLELFFYCEDYVGYSTDKALQISVK